MNIFLFVSLVFIITFILGRLIEKLHIPWVFAALIFGTFLAIRNPFVDITTSEIFQFLSKLGMYFLLFLVGLELNINKLKKRSGFIIRSTFVIILAEAVTGSLIVHYVFGYSWLVSGLVSLSFATVGEAILVPILDEFKIINKPLGQTIIGIGTADDILEVASLIVASIVVGLHSSENILFISTSLVVLLILTLGLTRLRNETEQFRFQSIESIFLLALFLLFIFIGIGVFADAAPLAALLAGVSLHFLPKKRLDAIQDEIRTLTYGFFAPIFFLSIGAELNIGYLMSFPLLILLVVAVSKTTKVLASYVVARKELGGKQAILLGIGLSVRFSTSIIIMKFLFDKQIIGADIFSVIIASSIIFKFIVPLLFANLLIRWKVVED